MAVIIEIVLQVLSMLTFDISVRVTVISILLAASIIAVSIFVSNTYGAVLGIAELVTWGVYEFKIRNPSQ